MKIKNKISCPYCYSNAYCIIENGYYCYRCYSIWDNINKKMI